MPLRFHSSLDDEVIDDFEFQARNLAGRILLPEAQFLSAARTALPKAQHQVAETRLWGDDLCTRIGMKGRRG